MHEASGKGNVLAVRFYNELLLTGGEKLKVDELAALGKVIDAIRNKKLQEEKSKNKPGAGKAKAAKVRMGADLDCAYAACRWRRRGGAHGGASDTHARAPPSHNSLPPTHTHTLLSLPPQPTTTTTTTAMS